MRMLPFSDIECITVLDGKTYAVTRSGERCRLKLRLCELEAMLPASLDVYKRQPGDNLQGNGSAAAADNAVWDIVFFHFIIHNSFK